MAGETDFRSQSRYNRFGLNVYPHPFFDPSNWYIPPTIKELYRWCGYLFLTNPVIGPIVRKKAAYVVTDLIYETDNADTEKTYKDLLEKTLKIKEFEIEMLLDYEVYGNAYCSLVYPFERYLVCPFCKYENLLKNTEWTYEGGQFRAKCGNCQAKTAMEPKDKPIRNRSSVRLIRWFPQYIDVRYNVLTGATDYILRIPRWLKTRMENPKINKVYVRDTPKEFLDAIRENNNILFDQSNIFSLKHESISMEDSSIGIPPILGVFKEVWLWQTYKRGQEAIALDHALPMTLLSPMPAPGAPSPHMSSDLNTWQGKMQSIIEKWRRDQNSLFTTPYPIQVSQIRGDANALSLHNDMEQSRTQIAGGMDVPPDFLYGNLTWTGGNVSLRVLENLLINRLARINSFLEDWLIPNLRRFFRLPKIKVRHSDFKMADDIQQKQVALNLRATNTVSDQTVLEELGFDYAKEQERKKREFDDRIREMEKNQIAQADIQAKTAWIQAQSQMQIQDWQTRYAQAAGMPIPGQPPAQPGQPGAAGQPGQPGMVPPNGANTPGAPAAPGSVSPLGSPITGMVPPEPPRLLPYPTENAVQMSSTGILSPETVELMATHFMKTTPPDQLQTKLYFMKQSEPALAAAIERRVKTIQDSSSIFEPLPEQKPPRRGPGKAVI